jgi:hypothetical protein
MSFRTGWTEKRQYPAQDTLRRTIGDGLWRDPSGSGFPGTFRRGSIRKDIEVKDVNRHLSLIACAASAPSVAPPSWMCIRITSGWRELRAAPSLARRPFQGVRPRLLHREIAAHSHADSSPG